MSESQYANDLHRILAALHHEPTDEQAGQAFPEEEDELDTIHVYPVQGGGMLWLPEPLDPQEDEEDEEDEPSVVDSLPPDPRPAAMNQPPLLVVFLLLLCVFLLFDVADNQLLTFMTPTATVTIVPQTHTVTTAADLPAAALQARGFAPLTSSLSQTVPATGSGHQEARQASGTLTFYNGLFTPQVVAQGTVLTGSDGVQVATMQPATIPPGNLTTGYGTVTVFAEAVQTGAAGNIAAGDITITINNGLLVKNSPFRGGQDARSFSVVTQADIQQVIAQLTPRVLQSEQAALTSQLHTNETLFSPACTPTSTADHQPGDEAAHVTVTVAERCTAVAYDQQAAQARGEQLLNEQERTLGKGYALVGDVYPSLLSRQAGTSIRVQFSATYVYQINEQALTALIAGHPKRVALLLLARIAGIQRATIAGVADDTPLPLDSGHLHFLLVSAGW